MESQVLNERIEWEARRVATAFGIKTFECLHLDSYLARFQGALGEVRVHWSLYLEDAEFPQLIGIDVGNDNLSCETTRMLDSSVSPWEVVPSSSNEFNAIMARGLHGLGFEDNSAISQLPSLSAHEKLELRLSLPREFWPQTWGDEEGVNYQKSPTVSAVSQDLA